MRMVYVTDIHDAFRALETLLAGTSADVYLLAGDLVYRVFPRYEAAWRYLELQEILAGYRLQSKGETLWDAARRLCRQGAPSPVNEQAREYLHLSIRAEAFLQKAYDRLQEALSRFEKKRIYLLPGNYDMDLQETALRDRDLHLRSVVVHGWRIAGYGGARVRTPGIPDHLQVRFREEQRAGGEVSSEAGDFFRTTRPDILAVHHPAYGHLDRLPGHGHLGSPGIRSYVDEARPTVVLSGHLHEDWGGEWADGVCYFNPSNFGRVVGVSHVRPGGHFMDLVLEADRLQVGTLRRIERGRIYDVVDYRPRPRGLETLILDETRFLRMGGRISRTRHIRPIRQLQRIKSFFLGYETPVSRELVRELRGIYRRIEGAGMHVAFDLLGSLNFGMAQRGSDLDLVVYLQGRECIPDEIDACIIPPPLAAVFEELKARQLKVEVCDSLDLDRVAEAIRKEDKEDGHLQRFVFYRAVCRPVNLRLIKSVENQLLGRDDLRKEMEMRLREYLRILVSSVRHVRSFEKYLARLRQEGVSIPTDIEEGIRKYLRSEWVP